MLSLEPVFGLVLDNMADYMEEDPLILSEQKQDAEQNQQHSS